MTPEQRLIIVELQKRNHEPRTAFDITKATGLGSRTVYDALRRLEDDNKIKSSFAPGPFPRRRVYYLPRTER